MQSPIQRLDTCHPWTRSLALALGAGLLTLLAASCAGDKKSADPDNLGKKDKGDSASDDDNGDDDSSGGSAYASANRVTLTNSLGNNPLTSQTTSTSKAEDQEKRFQGAKDKRTIEGRISAQRLARKGVGDVLGSAKQLAALEMEKGAGRSISDEVKLELALSALASRNYAFADYLLQDLTGSKDARVKAGAYNALGVVALKDERVPEAVVFFKEALKTVGNYKPALLNLGFTALRGGDMNTTKKALSDLQSDWFVQYGLISVARIEGAEDRADGHCKNVFEKEPAHKAALFNCALLELQNKRNFTKARELANKAGKARGGEASWDNKAYSLATDIDYEEAAQKRDAARKKAAEKAKEKAEKDAATKPAAKAGDSPAGAPAPAGAEPAGDAAAAPAGP